MPLIGGMAIGLSQALGEPPRALISWEGFTNDELALEYFGGAGDATHSSPVVTSAVPPCAGLSRLSLSVRKNNLGQSNKWIFATTEAALGYRPLCHVGENAPGLATELGRPILRELAKQAEQAGYWTSLYTTSTVYHGLPQRRHRCFYLLWNKDAFPAGPPKLRWFNRPMPKVAEVVKANWRGDGSVNDFQPEHDQPLQWLLHKTGMSYQELCASVAYQTLAYYVIKHGWLEEAIAGLDTRHRNARVLVHAQQKMRNGLGFYDNSTAFGNGPTRAIVGVVPQVFIHPLEPRTLAMSELYGLFGMPKDFPLLKPKLANMLCQNVPVNTARDIGLAIKAAVEGEYEPISPQYGCIPCQINAKMELVYKRVV